jgi:translation initiation factor IF-3
LIDEAGKMVGIKTVQEALRLADERGYDLIEIAPTSTPPVCKLGNFSKYLYQQEKKSKDAKKNKGGGGQVKEIRLRPKIGEHDFQVKLNAIERFLKERHKVRVSLVFFGREMEHQELGLKMIDRIKEKIATVGVFETIPQMYGNRLNAIIVPAR